MASTVPAKSQPLHNFSLPHLKWKNHRSGRSRLAGETSSSSPPHRSPPTSWRESPPPTSHAHAAPPPPNRQSSPSYVSRRPSPLHRQSPLRDSESESDLNCNKKPFDSSLKSVDNNKGKRSNKICIRFRKNNNKQQDDGAPDEHNSSTPLEDSAAAAATEEEESLPKTWNLRPRRPPMNKQQNPAIGGPPKIGTSENRTHEIVSSNNKELSELINGNNGVGKMKKPRISISLTRDEIEEDIFVMTGSKPSRRPRKRPRTVQRQLDTLFPGLWLGCITPDSYKVSEAPPKG